MNEEAERMAARILASCVLFQAQGMHPNATGFSWGNAVRNFEEAVKAWDVAKTPVAAVAAVSTALLALQIPPVSGPTRPSPEFTQGLERVVAGLTRIVNEMR